MRSRNSNPARGSAPTPTLLLLVLAAGLACSASLFGQAVASHASAKPASQAQDRVVARVNGVVITESQLQEETDGLYPSNLAHGGLRPDKLKEIREKALQELEVQELAWQQAVARHALAPMAQVQAEYQRIRKLYGPPAFDRSLREHGLTRQQYLKDLQRRMTLEREFQKQVVRPARMSDAALRAYYQKNLKKFQRPEQVKARLILVAVDAKATPDQQRQAQDKIQKLYQRLQAGEDFAKLAEQDSDDFYRVKGGDLGWVHRGRLEPEFEKVAFGLAVGQVSPPFHTPYGWNLMKVEGKQPARQLKFAEIRSVLKSQLEEEKAQELRRAWVERLRQGAKIEELETVASAGGH